MQATGKYQLSDGIMARGASPFGPEETSTFPAVRRVLNRPRSTSLGRFPMVLSPIPVAFAIAQARQGRRSSIGELKPRGLQRLIIRMDRHRYSSAQDGQPEVDQRIAILLVAARQPPARTEGAHELKLPVYRFGLVLGYWAPAVPKSHCMLVGSGCDALVVLTLHFEQVSRLRPPPVPAESQAVRAPHRIRRAARSSDRHHVGFHACRDNPPRHPSVFCASRADPTGRRPLPALSRMTLRE